MANGCSSILFVEESFFKKRFAFQIETLSSDTLWCCSLAQLDDQWHSSIQPIGFKVCISKYEMQTVNYHYTRHWRAASEQCDRIVSKGAVSFRAFQMPSLWYSLNFNDSKSRFLAKLSKFEIQADASHWSNEDFWALQVRNALRCERGSEKWVWSFHNLSIVWVVRLTSELPIC